MPSIALRKGQRLELVITDVAFGGDGIGRASDFVVFVPFVIAGETVEVQITAVKRSFATARLLQVITPSPHRVAPRCPHFTHCGGCQYQHIDYERQIELKHKQVTDIFQRIGKFSEPPVAAAVSCPQPFHYRNKIVLHGPGKPGFWNAQADALIPIDHCPIASEPINTALAALADKPLANEHLTLRSDSAGAVRTWLERRGAHQTSAQAVETGANDPVATPIEESVLGKTLQLPVGSFFQVNREMITLALDHARQAFRASGCGTLVDAYCGVGLFALLLADLARDVYGMEVDGRAIDAAKDNAQRLGVSNCKFTAGTTEALLSGTLKRCKLDDVCLILDPPRSGCGKAVLQILRKQRPRKLLYVSCAPPMLARDVKELVANGYQLERVTPFDMFPQTAHCEAVAELTLASRKNKP